MNITETALGDVLVLEPRVFADERGFFFESYNERAFADLGIRAEFVQDNHSCSQRGVLRGIHYQVQQPQGKLIRALHGEVFDVAVDLRRDSAHFGQWFGMRLSAQNRRILWIPPGFGHGFLTLSETAELAYKTTDYYAPQHERTLRWDDATVAIGWPLATAPLLSAKDRMGASFAEAEVYEPHWDMVGSTR